MKFELNNVDSIFDIFKQSELFETVIEIFLLNLLNVDCLLIRNNNLKSQIPNGEDDFNSKKYLDKFIKK